MECRSRKSKRQVRRSRRNQPAVGRNQSPNQQPLLPDTPGGRFCHFRESAQRLFRYRRDGELHPERLPDHEQGIWRHGGKETPCEVHL